jgi:ribonuclease HII
VNAATAAPDRFAPADAGAVPGAEAATVSPADTGAAPGAEAATVSPADADAVPAAEAATVSTADAGAAPGAEAATVSPDAPAAEAATVSTDAAASCIHLGMSTATISPDEAGPPAPAGSSRATRRAKRRRRSSGSRLFRYDRALGARFVAGADEAGRGCLAGPLVAAAVLFDYEALTLSDLRSLSALNDSKQHTAEARDALYPRVLRAATKVAVTSRCVRGIDARGLHNTNLAALRDVLARVACAGSLCLSDGFAVPPTGFEQRPVVGGDATSAAIAAASVVAKVSRDRFMQRMEERYPGWEFATHVGYSTPEHRAAIEKMGVSPLHRMSFQSMAYQQLAL